MLGLELRHLRLVRAIDESGTVTRAARELGITQSAVSQQLLDLEERVGQALFERTRPMMLTDAGHGFLARALPVLRELGAVESYVQELASGRRGVLRVSSDNILCFPWLPGAIGRFRRRHPTVTVRLEQHRDILAAVEKKKLDVGLSFPREVPDGLEMMPLFDDEMLAVLPPMHPLAVKKRIGAADLAGTDFIYHMELKDSVLYRRYLEPGAIELRSFTCIDQPGAILGMVGAGLGVTLLPSWSVAKEEAEGSVVTRPLRGKQGFRVRWAAIIRRDQEPPLAREFADGVRAEAQNRR